MFEDVWSWAGKFRKTEKNIGVFKTEIQSSLYTLLQHVAYWRDNKIFSTDEVCIRCKHKLVSIHPFPNGNGRHSRLYADLLVESFGGHPFSWGADQEKTREKYLTSLRQADKGNYDPLLEFARNWVTYPQSRRKAAPISKPTFCQKISTMIQNSAYKKQIFHFIVVSSSGNRLPINHLFDVRWNGFFLFFVM